MCQLRRPGLEVLQIQRLAIMFETKFNEDAMHNYAYLDTGEMQLSFKFKNGEADVKKAATFLLNQVGLHTMASYATYFIPSHASSDILSLYLCLLSQS